jgi:hypothetical protein
MPGDQIHRRRVPFPAPLAAQALQHGLERDIASTLDEQAHWQACRPSAALSSATQFGQSERRVLDAEEGRVHAIAWRENRTGTRLPSDVWAFPPFLLDPSRARLEANRGRPQWYGFSS